MIGEMKILYVTDARLPTEKAHGLQIMKTCEALVRAGHTVELIAPRRRNSLTDNVFAYYGIKTDFPLRRLFTIDLIRWGRLGFLAQEISFALAAALALRRGRDGIVYSRDEVILCVLSLCGFRRLVWESHDGAWNRAARILARRARAMVVVSNGLKKWYQERGVPPQKLTVVRNAIDTDAFANPEGKMESRARLQLPQDTKLAMYIGRLDGWKGSTTLLEASALLPLYIKVVVIGGDPDQTKRLAARYPRAQFLGSRPYRELADNQSAADALIVPNTGTDLISARFTSPLKLIAHMASGRPIIASDLPSIREIAGDGAALLVPPDDPHALAQAIEKVVSDPALAERLAERARAAVSRYSWSARAAALSRLLESVQ